MKHISTNTSILNNYKYLHLGLDIIVQTKDNLITNIIISKNGKRCRLVSNIADTLTKTWYQVSEMIIPYYDDTIPRQFDGTDLSILNNINYDNIVVYITEDILTDRFGNYTALRIRMNSAFSSIYLKIKDDNYQEIFENLSKNPKVENLKVYHIPYYNQEKGVTETLEFDILLTSSEFEYLRKVEDYPYLNDRFKIAIYNYIKNKT